MKADEIQIVELTKDFIIDVIIDGRTYPRQLLAGFKCGVLWKDYSRFAVHSCPREYFTDIIDCYFSIDGSDDPEKMNLQGKIPVAITKSIFKTDKEAV